LPTEYTEKHGKKAKIKGKKSKGEFMPAAQGQKQGQRRTSKAKKS